MPLNLNSIDDLLTVFHHPGTLRGTVFYDYLLGNFQNSLKQFNALIIKFL